MEIEQELEVDEVEVDEDEYWVIDKISDLRDLILPIIALFWLFYALSPKFNLFIDTNWGYIITDGGILLLFIVTVFIPLFIYFIDLTLRIIQKLWVSYDIIKTRITFRIIRINFWIFGFSSSFLAFLVKIPYFSFYSIGFGLLVIGIFNFVFGYENIAEDEKKIAKVQMTSEKLQLRPLNLMNIISLPLVIGVLIVIANVESIKTFAYSYFYLNISFSPFNIAMGGFITENIFCLLVNILSFGFSIGWLIIEFISTVGVFYIKKKRDNVSLWLKLAYIIAFFYFVIKLIIFNVASELDDTSSTLFSMGISMIGGLVTKNAKKALNFFHLRKVPKQILGGDE